MLIKDIYQPIRYIIISIILYLYVFLGLWIAVEKLKFDNFFSYVVIYASVYLIDYLLTLKWVFRVSHRNFLALKYLLYLASFLLLNSLIYNMLQERLYFMNAAIIVAIILFPLRYISSKFFVYK